MRYLIEHLNTNESESSVDQPALAFRQSIEAPIADDDWTLLVMLTRLRAHLDVTVYEQSDPARRGRPALTFRQSIKAQMIDRDVRITLPPLTFSEVESLSLCLGSSKQMRVIFDKPIILFVGTRNDITLRAPNSENMYPSITGRSI